MKNALAIALVVTGMLLAAGAEAQLQLPRVSPQASVSQTIGLTEITINYSRPGVRGRAIWGELVPWNEMWRTGANEATTISLSTEATLGDVKVPAGTYALFTIPGEKEWTVVLNSDTGLWGSYEHDKAKDVARITTTPRTGPSTEWLMFTFQNLGDDSAEVVLNWKETELRFPVRVEVVERFMEGARAAVGSAAADDWRTPLRAANYAIQRNVHADEAMAWVERSIAIQSNFFNLSAKARLQAAAGKHGEAVKTGRQALEAAKKAERPPDTSEMEKLVGEWERKGRS
jgi:hypothetical protein